jgi:hypothetical protein
MARRKNREKKVDHIEGTFVCGWAEYLRPVNNPILDDKGRLLSVDQKPPKIVTRLMVELDDGSCVPVHGEHFESLEMHSIPLPLSKVFPGKLKEVHGIAAKAYKKGEKVKVKRTVFKDNGWTEYDEVE